MNNIENSIQHLQSSIDKRSNVVTRYHKLINEYLDDYESIFDNNTGDVTPEDYELEVRQCKGAVAELVKQQKIEKKMLAMMYDLQDNKNNSWICSANQLAKSLDEL